MPRVQAESFVSTYILVPQTPHDTRYTVKYTQRVRHAQDMPKKRESVCGDIGERSRTLMHETLSENCPKLSRNFNETVLVMPTLRYCFVAIS